MSSSIMPHSTISLFPVILLFVVGLGLGAFFLFRRYPDVSKSSSYLSLLGSLLVSAGFILNRLWNVEEIRRRGLHRIDTDEIIMKAIAAGVAIVFLTAFVLRLWGRWIGGKATAAENQPGVLGLRAWFSAGNVLVAATLVPTLWFGFGVAPAVSLLLLAAALAAAPLLRLETPAAAPEPVADDLSGEREKILAMLEAGKLTPDESAELLQALRQSIPAASRQIPLTSGQRLMLIGAAMVGLGFFLPWLVINPGAEASRMMSQMQSSMSSSFSGAMSFPGGMNFPGLEMKTTSVSISGGDIPRGLGWAALLFALCAAALPYLATTFDAATARTVRLLCLGIGSFIVVYLLVENPRFIGVGLIMAAGGYALEVTGALRERKASAPLPQAPRSRERQERETIRSL